MKLLFVLSEYLPDSGGGIISYYADILPHLIRGGHSVDVLVASHERKDRTALMLDGVNITYITSKNVQKSSNGFERFRAGYPTFSAFLPLAWAAYEQAHHGAGYDLVETTDFPLLFVPWVVSRDSPPVVVSLHGSCGQLDWHEYPERSSMDGDLLRLVERGAFSSACSVYANSERNARFWETAASRTIPILLPTNEGTIREKHHGLTRSENGIVVGRFQNWKGSRVLCEALRLLPDETVNWFGRDVVDQFTGIRQSELLKRDYPQLLGSRLILDETIPRDQVLAKIEKSAYLCVPSQWDVFNLTAVEAMILGTPVICSTRAGASMLIEHGVNGFLFDPENPKELAMLIQRVRSLNETERNSITEEARAAVKNRLNSDVLTQERISYYREIIASSLDWKTDEWLRLALAPRQESDKRIHQLLSYSASELIEATGVQILAGLKRRFK